MQFTNARFCSAYKRRKWCLWKAFLRLSLEIWKQGTFHSCSFVTQVLMRKNEHSVRYIQPNATMSCRKIAQNAWFVVPGVQWIQSAVLHAAWPVEMTACVSHAKSFIIKLLIQKAFTTASSMIRPENSCQDAILEHRTGQNQNNGWKKVIGRTFHPLVFL